VERLKYFVSDLEWFYEPKVRIKYAGNYAMTTPDTQLQNINILFQNNYPVK